MLCGIIETLIVHHSICWKAEEAVKIIQAGVKGFTWLGWYGPKKSLGDMFRRNRLASKLIDAFAEFGRES